MRIGSLDHLVLTVADVSATTRFYVGVLGMEEVTFAEGRKALSFGRQKINLHQHGAEIAPHAHLATPGSADLCFIAETPLEEVIKTLADRGVGIELGPVERAGAMGKMASIYIRDPDRNLVEISNY